MAENNLLFWAQLLTDGYPGVDVKNFTSSWKDGLAFCAIIHNYQNKLLNFDELKKATKEDMKNNHEKAFTLGEKHFRIARLMEPEDMIVMNVPDKLSVMCYLSEMRKHLQKRKPEGNPYLVKNLKENHSIDLKNDKKKEKFSSQTLKPNHLTRTTSVLGFGVEKEIENKPPEQKSLFEERRKERERQRLLNKDDTPETKKESPNTQDKKDANSGGSTVAKRFLGTKEELLKSNPHKSNSMSVLSTSTTSSNKTSSTNKTSSVIKTPLTSKVVPSLNNFNSPLNVSSKSNFLNRESSPNVNLNIGSSNKTSNFSVPSTPSPLSQKHDTRKMSTPNPSPIYSKSPVTSPRTTTSPRPTDTLTSPLPTTPTTTPTTENSSISGGVTKKKVVRKIVRMSVQVPSTKSFERDLFSNERSQTDFFIDSFSFEREPVLVKDTSIKDKANEPEKMNRVAQERTNKLEEVTPNRNDIPNKIENKKKEEKKIEDKVKVVEEIKVDVKVEETKKETESSKSGEEMDSFAERRKEREKRRLLLRGESNPSIEETSNESSHLKDIVVDDPMPVEEDIVPLKNNQSGNNDESPSTNNKPKTKTVKMIVKKKVVQVVKKKIKKSELLSN